jgi:hypothetical protein
VDVRLCRAWFALAKPGEVVKVTEAVLTYVAVDEKRQKRSGAAGMIFCPARGGWRPEPAARLFLMTERVTRHGLAQGRRGSTAAVVAAMLLMSFIPVLHAASTPVLMLLEHTEAGKQIRPRSS